MSAPQFNSSLLLNSGRNPAALQHSFGQDTVADETSSIDSSASSHTQPVQTASGEAPDGTKKLKTGLERITELENENAMLTAQLKTLHPLYNDTCVKLMKEKAQCKQLVEELQQLVNNRKSIEDAVARVTQLENALRSLGIPVPDITSHSDPEPELNSSTAVSNSSSSYSSASAFYDAAARHSSAALEAASSSSLTNDASASLDSKEADSSSSSTTSASAPMDTSDSFDVRQIYID